MLIFSTAAPLEALKSDDYLILKAWAPLKTIASFLVFFFLSRWYYLNKIISSSLFIFSRSSSSFSCVYETCRPVRLSMSLVISCPIMAGGMTFPCFSFFPFFWKSSRGDITQIFKGREFSNAAFFFHPWVVYSLPLLPTMLYTHSSGSFEALDGPV